MNKIVQAIKLLRIHQWMKNTFIFLPLFFDRCLMDLDYLLPAILAFISFSFAASGVYCFNDIYDVESDRKHPKKCKRPIASGSVSVYVAYGIMVLCFILSVAILVIGGGNTIEYGIIICYILVNTSYCIKLKQIAIVDVL